MHVDETSQDVPDIGAPLLAWYAREKRDLPWRRTRDPYAIWLSEVMLQQTRVDTVKPYFARFLERFPTVRHLADASESDVLGEWAGLGYYRRARMLHRAAREIASRDVFPASREALLEISGVGPYTASAVASIAYAEPVELVDGNVARVFARVFAMEDDPKTPRGMAAFWRVARRELRAHDPSSWNQALMELGATVCTPKKPACEACPLARVCLARAEERVADLPRMSKKAAPKEEPRTALVLHGPSGVLFGERNSEGRFGGLSEPPQVPGDLDATAARLAFDELLPAPLRDPERSLVDCGIVVHVLSHRRLNVRVYAAHSSTKGRKKQDSMKLEAPSRGEYVAFSWGSPDGLDRGTSTLAKKLLEKGTPS